MRALGLLTLVLLSTAAQGQALGTPRPWTQAAVTLLEPGRPPLLLRRFVLAPGPAAKWVSEAWGTWETSTPVRPMVQRFPRQTTPFSAQVTDGGTVALTFAAATAVAAPNSRIDPYTQAMLAAMDGVHGTLTLDGAGNGLRYAVRPSPRDEVFQKTPNQITSGSFMALELTRGLLTHLMLPLPAVPIGVGATWKVERFVHRGMLAYLEMATVTLQKVDGNSLSVTYDLSARVDPRLAAQAEEMKVLILKGQGTATLRLDHPLPTQQSDDFTIEATIVASDGARAAHHAELHTAARLVVE